MDNTTDSEATGPTEKKNPKSTRTAQAPAETTVAAPATVPAAVAAPATSRRFRTPVLVGTAAGALVVGVALGGVGGFALGHSAGDLRFAGANSPMGERPGQHDGDHSGHDHHGGFPGGPQGGFDAGQPGGGQPGGGPGGQPGNAPGGQPGGGQGGQPGGGTGGPPGQGGSTDQGQGDTSAN